MSTVNLSQDAFDRQIRQEKRDALVDFWAPWCGHCRRLGPAFDQVAREHPGVLVAAVNIDDAPELARDYGIQVIPTLVAFRQGEAAASLTGPESKAEIQAFLEKNLPQ